jgi:hypothetical protein
MNLAGGPGLLRPEEQACNAMLDGWGPSRRRADLRQLASLPVRREFHLM